MISLFIKKHKVKYGCMDEWKYGNGRRRGFTLVELVLVISIVVVLSVISGPIYRSYAYKARQAEGYALIGTIRSAQESYYGEYSEFLDDNDSSASGGGSGAWFTANEEVLGIDARPNKYYTWFCVSNNSNYNDRKYKFKAMAKGAGAADIIMYYNRTEGVTMQAGVSLDF